MAGQAQTVTLREPEMIAEPRRVEGYKATLDPTKPDANPIITSGGAECQSVQYHAGFTDQKLDAEQIDLWNREKRFVRAYIGTDGDAVLEMDVDVEPGGIDRKLFVDYLEIGASLPGRFASRACPD